MSETTTKTIPTTNSGDPEEVDSVYHVILNDHLKDEFIKWLEDKNQEAVTMDKDINTNTWKNNDAFFGIGKYPIVKKKPTWRDRLSPNEQGNFFLGGREYPPYHIPTAANNLALEAKGKRTRSAAATSTPAATTDATKTTTPATREISPLTLRSRSASGEKDKKITRLLLGDGGRRKKRTRRKRKARKKRTRKRN